MKLNPSHPALFEARTIHTKMIREAQDIANVLKPASGNKKLGNGRTIISSHKWKGFPMFSLTLEERATCPTTCHHWDDCYGNNMLLAHRVREGVALEHSLMLEVEALAHKYPRGFVIRLHVLGDFYSVRYVGFWQRLLFKFPNLHIFGYTGWDLGTDVGNAIDYTRQQYQDRFWIRHSCDQDQNGNAIYAAEEEYNGKTFDCPEQTGLVDSCVACGLCWTTKKTVRFLTH